MAPPANCGARVEPWRARPVPFWRYGLAPPPETAARLRVACVPRRRAASSASTTSCTSGPLNGTPNTSSSTVTVWVPPRIWTSGIGADLHRAALGPGDRAAHEHQVLGGDELDDLQPALGDALATHAAGAANALEHARGRRRGADRARRAHVVRAVGLGAGLEVVALDRPLEALALALAGHLDGLADLEGLHGHGVADLQLAGLVAELDERAHGRGAGLLEVAELGPGEGLLAHAAEAELDGLVAVGVVGADGGHRAGAGLEHGHALDAALVGEPLGHAELLGEDGGHWANRRRGGSRCQRQPEGVRAAGASRRSSAWAGGCRSGACASGSRSAPGSPCP